MDPSVRITTLDDFLKWTQRFTRGEYLFRGVSNVGYKIEASAYRRLDGTDKNFENFLKINQELIKGAWHHKLEMRDGKDLKDLEILAALQHAGAATCLIDFTYSALIALWFACENDPSDKISDGKVVAVSNKPSEFTEITLDLLEKKIDCFLQDPTDKESKLYRWRPWQLNNRIGPQQSVFLFGVSEIDSYEWCIIDGTSKKALQNQLQQSGNITDATLFPDFEGFARRHRHDIPYIQLSSDNYKKIAEAAHRRGDYLEAITNFNKAIDLAPGDARSYHDRGLARYNLKQYREAIDDFDQAIALETGSADIYYQRGLAKCKLGQYREAIEDFNQTINIDDNYEQPYYERGQAKYHLEDFDGAEDDVQTALKKAEAASDRDLIDRIEEFMRIVNRSRES